MRSSIGFWAASSTGTITYQINNSVILNPGSTPYLYWTPSGAATSDTLKTLSVWFKLGNTGADGLILSAGNNGTNHFDVRYVSNVMTLLLVSGGTSVLDLETTQVLRDTTAWYHLVVAYDSTQGTSSNRCKMYLNGEQVTNFGVATYPSSSQTIALAAQSVKQTIGRRDYDTSRYWDGYLAELNVIDGQALDPSYFGEIDTTYGQWIPKQYTGSYGNNGFYLDFSVNTAYGTDASGNGNDFTDQ